jgi:hypothetical protein
MPSRQVLNDSQVNSVRAIPVVLAVLLCSAASTASADEKADWAAARERTNQVIRSRPARLEGPLRVDNISDEEVRELEAVMDEHFPGAIVNIGGVTAGCPCEDGTSCDSQVWVVTHLAGESNGLMLSQIGDRWAIRPLQQWWLRRDHLYSLMRAALDSNATNRYETYRRFQEQQNQLQREFPFCKLQD